MNLLTPQPADAFSKFFVQGFDERQFQVAPFGFMAFFGIPGANGSQTLFSDDVGVVEIDIMRAHGERLAATVHRGSGNVTDMANHTITDQRFTTLARKWPLLEVLNPIESGKLLYRQAGENPYSGMSRVERNRLLAKGLNADAVVRCLRTMNYLASISLLEGVQPAIIGTENEALIYDYHRDPELIIEVDAGWNESSSKPLTDIDLACKRLEEKGYVQPNFIGIAEDAFTAFIEREDVQTLADNRRFELIQVSTNNPVPPEYERFIKAGWIARGRLRTPGGRTLWMFNYNHNYTDPTTGQPTRYLPNGTAFITDINARRDRYFGPADRLPVTGDERMWYAELFGFDMEAAPTPLQVEADGNLFDPRMFSFDAYRSPDRKTVVMRTQAAPIFATTQTDGIATLKDLIQEGGEGE